MSKSRKLYSDEQLLGQLSDLSKKLGHTPSLVEIGKASSLGQIASPATISNRFGTIRQAQELAGLEPNRQPNRTYTKKYTQKELVAQLQLLSRLLGRTPTIGDVNHNEFNIELASSGTFNNQFGSFAKALGAAGFDDFQKRLSVTTRDNHLLFIFLRDAAIAMEFQVPTKTEFDQFASSHRFGCGFQTLIEFYGSIECAFMAAGIEIETISDEQRRNEKMDEAKSSFITALQTFAANIGHTPNVDEIKHAKSTGKFPYSYRAGYRYFGSWPNVLHAAGLKQETSGKKNERNLPTRESLSESDVEILMSLTEYAKELDHTPTINDLDQATTKGKPFSREVLTNRFGSPRNAIILAGLTPNKRGRPRKSTITTPS